jgi:lipopolysaccharide export system protein LptA
MRSALLSLFFVLLGASSMGAQRKKSERDERPFEKFSPIFDILPAGSIITDVRVPRFDKKKRRAALMRASMVKIISEQQIDAENLEVRVFSSKDEKETYRVHMGTAEFRRETGILEAKELITLRGKGIQGRGTGGLFLLDSRQGFVRGPVSTRFTVPPKKKAEKAPKAGPVTQDPPRTALPPAPIPALDDEFAPDLEPKELTPAELRDLESLLQSHSRSVLADRAPTREFITRSLQLSTAGDVSFRSFTKRVNRRNLLAKVSPKKSLSPKIVELLEGELQIECEGGMYLNPEKGHISYLRNIVVTEQRFSLTCSGHLKAFFDPKNLAESNQDTAPDMADLKTIVASGGVRIVLNDLSGHGPPIIARGEIAIIDVRTRDVVLQGGTPSFVRGLNSLRADEPDLYLRIHANGNVFAEDGRWTTTGDLAALENLKDAQAQKKNQGQPAPPQDRKATTPEPPPVDLPEPAKKKKEEAADPKDKDGPKTITATCTGGIYFDAKDGHIVYLGDIHLADPRFSMSAKKEIKIFLRKKDNATADQLVGPESWGEVDRVVASGEVTFSRMDPAGLRAPITAKAEHVVFNLRSADVLLKGGSPTIQQGDNALQAGKPDLYLRLYENGSLFAEPGPWTTAGDLANLRTKAGEQKKPAKMIVASCKGGLFFDSLKGHIVYLEDILVIEPRFRMKCTGTMRIHLKLRENAERDRLEGPEAFSDVDKIVALGGVTVTKKDPRGRAATVTATAASATYDATSGNIVLRGGRPMIQQGKSFLKAREDGLWLLFKADGYFHAKKGKWENSLNHGDFDELRKQQEAKEEN